LDAKQHLESLKFGPNIYTNEEDSCSDDELVTKIKLRKCKKATARADLATEHRAISDVIAGV
jgi:hypothetical protein